jgi:hypothetical protein
MIENNFNNYNELLNSCTIERRYPIFPLLVTPMKGRRQVGIVCHRAHKNYGGLCTVASVIVTLTKLGNDCTIINFPEESTMSRFFNPFFDTNFRLHTALPKEKMYELSDKYDAFVVTPGQIWNYAMYEYGYEKNGLNYYLDFVDSTKSIKISFGVSFGTDKLTFGDGKREYMTKLFMDFHYISVREKTGVKLLRELGVEAKHVFDPVFCNDATFWRSMSMHKKRKNEDKGFLLSYILSPSQKVLYFVVNTSSKLSIDYKLTDCNQSKSALDLYKSMNIFDKLQTKTDVSDWLWMIDNAKFIITDSFHCVCFALIFNKEFAVLTRSNMNTRLDTILEPLGLQGRMLNRDGILDIGSLPSIDWGNVNQQIEIWRTDAIEWICNAISSGKRQFGNSQSKSETVK